MPRIIKQDTADKTHRFSKKAAIIVIAAVVVVVAAGASAWLLLGRPGGEKQQSSEDMVFTRRTEQLQDADVVGAEVSTASQKAFDEGNVAEFERIYAEAIAKQDGAPSVQANLYIALAQGLVGLAQDAKALPAAQKAEKLDSDQLYTRVTLPLIGYTAYRLGDKVLALEYLRKTHDLQKDDQYLESGVLKETEDFIKELEAQQ